MVGNSYTYAVTVLRVIDGDTVDVTVDLGMHISVYKRLRIYGLNTPELRGGTDETKALAREAKTRLIKLLENSPKVYIKSYMDATGKYGRLLADLLVEQNGSGMYESIADILIAEGLGVVY